MTRSHTRRSVLFDNPHQYAVSSGHATNGLAAFCKQRNLRAATRAADDDEIKPFARPTLLKGTIGSHTGGSRQLHQTQHQHQNCGQDITAHSATTPLTSQQTGYFHHQVSAAATQEASAYATSESVVALPRNQKSSQTPPATPPHVSRTTQIQNSSVAIAHKDF